LRKYTRRFLLTEIDDSTVKQESESEAANGGMMHDCHGHFAGLTGAKGVVVVDVGEFEGLQLRRGIGQLGDGRNVGEGISDGDGQRRRCAGKGQPVMGRRTCGGLLDY
jgi:hypothetical protein